MRQPRMGQMMATKTDMQHTEPQGPLRKGYLDVQRSQVEVLRLASPEEGWDVQVLAIH